MTSPVIFRRYAQALFDEATNTTSVMNDVVLLQKTLNSSPELEHCLKSPVVPRQKKIAILQTLFAEQIQAVTLRFLQMLITRGRESLLHEIIHCFLTLTDETRGIARVYARVYSEMSGEGRKRLQNVLSSRLKRSVKLTVSVDTTLMGGIVLVIGDTVYDGSVRHQLSLLKARLQV